MYGPMIYVEKVMLLQRCVEKMNPLPRKPGINLYLLSNIYSLYTLNNCKNPNNIPYIQFHTII